MTSLPESEPSENIIGVTNSATTAEAPVPTNVLSLIANDAIVETVVEPAVETAGLEIVIKVIFCT